MQNFKLRVLVLKSTLQLCMEQHIWIFILHAWKRKGNYTDGKFLCYSCFFFFFSSKYRGRQMMRLWKIGFQRFDQRKQYLECISIMHHTQMLTRLFSFLKTNEACPRRTFNHPTPPLGLWKTATCKCCQLNCSCMKRSVQVCITSDLTSHLDKCLISYVSYMFLSLEEISTSAAWFHHSNCIIL